MARILIAVTHLLGSGHLVRAQHLARALAQAGHAVTLASGGMPLRAAKDAPYAFAQLPPVKIEGVDFRNLLDEAGRPIGDERGAARRTMLAELATPMAPDIVITEHFPFGRRQLAGEFLDLIAAAKAANPAALILSSIRDVLVAPRPDRVEEAHRRLEALFDAVLVHGDEAFLALNASWPVTPELATKLHYTGYLTAPSLRAERSNPEGLRKAPGLLRSARNDDGADILVSGGGSGAALPLFETATTAARLLGDGWRWRILVGRATDPTAFAGLTAAAPAHLTVEWTRPDFPALLEACALSISQAGYNTVLDLVEAGRPAIVVPFDEGGETEQAIRAAAMQRAGLACSLVASELTPARLAQAATAALKETAPPRVAIDRDGAAGTVAVVARLLAKRG
jgi:predicted glycosyltransferase